MIMVIMPRRRAVVVAAVGQHRSMMEEDPGSGREGADGPASCYRWAAAPPLLLRCMRRSDHDHRYYSVPPSTMPCAYIDTVHYYTPTPHSPIILLRHPIRIGSRIPIIIGAQAPAERPCSRHRGAAVPGAS